jgi:hypothetical protein
VLLFFFVSFCIVFCNAISELKKWAHIRKLGPREMFFYVVFFWFLVLVFFLRYCLIVPEADSCQLNCFLKHKINNNPMTGPVQLPQPCTWTTPRPLLRVSHPARPLPLRMKPQRLLPTPVQIPM